MNIGSPDAPDTKSVRRYLREFLSDKRVIDLPFILRNILLYGVILPFRPRQSAHAYQSIWTASGSPLMNHSQNLCQALQMHLGSQYQVVLGMRYGKPCIQDALTQLEACSTITVVPLFPQYSSAATGSAIEAVMTTLAKRTIVPSMTYIRDFYQHEAFLVAQATLIKPYIENHDYLLFSYHGVPERHLQKGGCAPVCTALCRPQGPELGCYRAQCLKTSELLAQLLQLSHYGSSFQSRLGKTPWIKPYTDVVFEDLAAQGIKRLAVACPSFVADCLETLEEIGVRGKEQWLKAGGEELTLIPCMNHNPEWVDALSRIITDC
jgi:ferrochelatase